MRISLFAAAVAERLIFYFFRRKRLKKKERYAIITIMSCRKREVTMQETTNLQKTMSIQACTERVQKIVAVSYPCAKAYVHSFGCQLNVSDGEKIKGLLQSMGFSLTETHEDADVIVFNTCAVRESAEDRVYGMLGVMKKYKETHPRTILILSGCMGSEPKTLEKVRAHYSFIDILMGTASIGELPRLLATYYDTKKFVYDMDSTAMPSEQMQQVRNSGFKASVPIMYGCNNFCTYCIVPYVRGRERSRQPEVILREVQHLIQDGYKEIMLLGQNVNSYGKDLEQPISFAELLRKINAMEGEFVIRFMSSHPKDATPELLDTILSCEKVGQHLHLPVQCGSDAILSAMNRRYTVEQYLKTVDYLRERRPDFSLTSDLIVGFPNESEADFQGTLDLIQRVQYDNLYTFIYSKRSGTKAANMPDATSDAEKRQRMERLLTLQREIATKNYRRFLGRTMRVLVEGDSKRGDGWLFGKSNEAIIVEFMGDCSLIGTFVSVQITESKNWAVSGRLLDDERKEAVQK